MPRDYEVPDGITRWTEVYRLTAWGMADVAQGSGFMWSFRKLSDQPWWWTHTRIRKEDR